jgi:hypothetical protein
MKKLTILAIALLLLGAMSSKAQAPAQFPVLVNTSWKTFISEISDTLTLHIKQDSSWVTNSSGQTVVKSVCKVAKDTISMRDVDGMYACPDAEGVYTIKVMDNLLSFTLVNDGCQGRAGSLPGSKWMKVGGGQ